MLLRNLQKQVRFWSHLMLESWIRHCEAVLFVCKSRIVVPGVWEPVRLLSPFERGWKLSSPPPGIRAALQEGPWPRLPLLPLQPLARWLSFALEDFLCFILSAQLLGPASLRASPQQICCSVHPGTCVPPGTDGTETAISGVQPLSSSSMKWNEADSCLRRANSRGGSAFQSAWSIGVVSLQSFFSFKSCYRDSYR